MTNTMTKSRRAISPILATLLLVVIAVAAIVVTYAWIMAYMSNANQQAGVFLFEANVDFYRLNNQSDSSKIAIDIGNSGTQGTTIIALYVGTSETNMQQQTFTPAQPQVNKGQLVTITINYDWTPGTTYYFKVLGQSGVPLGPFTATPVG